MCVRMMEWNERSLGFQLLIEKSRMVKYWMLILLGFFLLFLFFLQHTYSTFLDCTGLVFREEEHYYVKIMVQEHDVSYLSHRQVLIGDRKETFQILEISDSYTIGNDGKNYREVWLSFPLLDSEKIENNILFLTIEKETLSGWKWIQKAIKKGVYYG